MALKLAPLCFWETLRPVCEMNARSHKMPFAPSVGSIGLLCYCRGPSQFRETSAKVAPLDGSVNYCEQFVVISNHMGSKLNLCELHQNSNQFQICRVGERICRITDWICPITTACVLL